MILTPIGHMQISRIRLSRFAIEPAPTEPMRLGILTGKITTRGVGSTAFELRGEFMAHRSDGETYASTICILPQQYMERLADAIAFAAEVWLRHDETETVSTLLMVLEFKGIFK